jgi:hypothetical protein
MSRFAKYGMNPNEMSGTMGQAGRQMGAIFTNMSGARQVDLTARAAEVAQSRLMTAQQYIGGLGQLAQVGGGQKQLEEIMANAVARGVGNAKNISDLLATVTGIANRRTSESGVNVTAGATSLVTRSVSALMTALPGDANEAARQARAALDIQNINARVTTTGMDLPSVVGFAGLSQRFPNVSAAGRIAMQRLTMEDVTQMESLQDKIGRAKGAEKTGLEREYIGLARTLGVSEAVVNEKGEIRADSKDFLKNIRTSKIDMVVSRLSGTGSGEEVRRWLETGGKSKISEAGRAALKTFMDTSAEGAAQIMGIVGKENEVVKANIGGLKGSAKSMADVRTTQAAVEAGAITQGQGVFGKDFTDALSNFSKDFKATMEAVNPRELQKNAAEAAEKMNFNFSKFDGSVERFDAVVKRLEQKLELTPVGEGLSKAITSIGDKIRENGKDPYVRSQDRVPSVKPTVR